MNPTLEQYRSSLYGLMPDYRDRFSEQVIATLSRYVPPGDEEAITEEIRRHRQQIHELIKNDESRDRYELTYLERIKRHTKHKKAYEADTPFTP